MIDIADGNQIRLQTSHRSGHGFSNWQRSLLGGLICALPVIVFGLLILAFAPPYIVRLAYAGFVALVVVVGLQIFMGNSLGVNFSHTVFVAIGAYSVAILSTPTVMKKLIIPNAPFGLANLAIHPLLAALAGIVIVALIAFLTGLVIMRITGIGADILTLCMQIVAHSIFIHWTDLFKGYQAFYGIPTILNLQWAIVIAVVAIIVARLFKDSPWGVQLRAAAENHLAARSSGVNVALRRLLAWILSAVICGGAGMMFAFYVGTITARSFYFSYVFLTIAMLILGGMRTVSGAVVGVFVIEFGIEIIRMLENGPQILGFRLPTMYGLSGLALGGVIVICMAFRPSGVMGNVEFDDIFFRLIGRLKKKGLKYYDPRKVLLRGNQKKECSITR
jgi:branched-chain amino acid transport system permease protein